VLKRIYGQVRASYLRSKFGYPEAGSGRRSRWLAPLANLHPGAADVFAASVMFLPSPRHGASLLDVGCGGGDFMLRMRDRGWTVAGVETDPIAVERARDRGLEVHQGKVGGAAYGDSTFDAITMSHVIEHVHDPRDLLAQCRRLLKPAGTLVILTPNSAGWGHRHFGADWLGLDPPRHIHVFNPQNMRRLLVSARLAPTRIATLAINASAVWPTSAAIRRSRSSPAGDRPAIVLRSTTAGIARQAVERPLRIVDPAAGEDLLTIATRTE
jgi:2-polyprenyl-3-methyl-5-hydroxy-6-metoxy-1,4-benzoquinol methylase